MGLIRSVRSPMLTATLADHEGHVAQVWRDGTEHVVCGFSSDGDANTVAFVAVCSCRQWRSAATVDREPGSTAFLDLPDLPGLADEWLAHTLGPLAEAAGHRTRARFDNSLGFSGYRAVCSCSWQADGEPAPAEAGTLRDQRGHQQDVIDGNGEEVRRR